MTSSTEWPVVSSLPQYLETVLETTDKDTLLFRGQRSAKWGLKPKLARMDRRTDQDYLESERELVSAFLRQSLPYLEGELGDRWDELAVAQHHGLATRLLDWSSNALVGLWFAVRERPLRDTPGAVYIFAPEPHEFEHGDDDDPYSGKRTVFFRPNHLSQRIVVQHGWFSVHKFNTRSQQFSSLGRVSAYRERIEKVIIPPEAFSRLRADLDRVGINDATLFPGLDGLTRYLNWQISRRDDLKPNP